MKQLHRLILISRPAGYIMNTSVYLAGLIAGGLKFNIISIVGALFFTLPMGLIVYGPNDISDRESDAANERKGGRDGAIVQEPEILYIKVAALLFFAVFLLLLIGLHHFASASSWLMIGVFGYIYSIKPFRLKSRPGFDSLSNGLLWILGIYLTGYWINRVGIIITFPAIHTIIAIILTGAAVHALGTMPDYEVDKQAGDMTIGVKLGKTSTYILCAILFLLCSALIRHPVYKGYFLIAAAISIFGLYSRTPRTARLQFSAVLCLFPVMFFMRLFIS